MKRLLINRIGALFFSLTVIVVLGFWLTQAIPGDPVQRMLGVSNPSDAGRMDKRSERYDALYYQMGYELPDFYFTWTNLCVPDSFYKIPQQERRSQLIALSTESGKPEEVYLFRKTEEVLMHQINNSSELKNEDKIIVLSFINHLQKLTSLYDISKYFNSSSAINTIGDSITRNSLGNLKMQFQSFENKDQQWKLWVPVIEYHSKNHFQQWLFGNDKNYFSYNESKGLLNGDLGYSTVTNRSVLSILSKAFKITFIISALAIFIAIFFAIPISVILVFYRKRKIVQLAPGILLLFYTIPVFFMGTMLLMLFANPNVLKLFPSSGVAPIGGFNSSMTAFQIIIQSLPYLVLPLITYTIGSLAFFIRMLQASMEDQLSTDYIRTARAKGANERRIIGVHALRNCLIPFVTIASSAFPAMISGSIILENIYSIPGMGTEIVRAIQNLDYPVMIGFFLLMGIVTICIFMLSDLIHGFIDPRLNYKLQEDSHD